MSKRGIFPFAAGAAVLSFGVGAAQAQSLVVNPSGEVYDTSGGNVAIDPGGVAPLSETGWQGTIVGTPGVDGAEAIGNNPNSGGNRISFGATDASENAAEDVILFQETGAVIAEGDIITLDFFGRAFYQFDAGTDVQTSFFGYLGGSDLVQVDAVQHATTVSGEWNATSHAFTVVSGSALIGEELVIGFFTDTPGQGSGGFTSIDDVSLDITPIPEPGMLSLAGLGGLGLLRRRRHG